MRLGVMQPYFFPYIGYFQLIQAVDSYVVYDDVTFIKGGWINRNNIFLNGKKHLLTLKVKKASSYKLINEIEYDINQKKAVKTIQQAYIRAPFFKDVFPLIDRVFDDKDSSLVNFFLKSIQAILGYLECNTKIILSSNIPKNNGLKGQDKILDICRLTGANQYINAIGGQALYSKSIFQRRGIDLYFLKTLPIEYAQFGNVFIPNLSIIDVLMFNSKQQIESYLGAYELI